MKLFKNKKKKQENEDGGIWIIKMALQEALRELEEERQKSESLREDLRFYENETQNLKEYNTNLENNLGVLQNTIENVKNLCKDSKGKTIGISKILKELGE